MKFITGTEMFRQSNYKGLKSVFTKGTPFLSGQKFTLTPGVMSKDIDSIKNIEDSRQYIYARSENGSKKI